MKVERHDPPPPPMPEAEYTITLTETEVKDLLKVIGCISGDGYPERNTTDALWDELTKISRLTETPFQSLQLERKPPIHETIGRQSCQGVARDRRGIT